MLGDKIIGWFLAILVCAGAVFWHLKREAAFEAERAITRQAVAQLKRWADKLDAQTTETGVYIRWPGEELPEGDPWGQKLKVHYSQGGMAETLTVSSAGPDGEWHTPDDFAVKRMSVNFKGAGTGIKNNAEEVTANAARGLVKGVADQVRKELKGQKQP